MKNVLLFGAGGNATYNFVKCLNMDRELRSDIKLWYRDDSFFGRIKAEEYCDEFYGFGPPNNKGMDFKDFDYIHSQPDESLGEILSNPDIKDKNIHSRNEWSKFRDKWLCQFNWARGRDDIQVHRATDALDVVRKCGTNFFEWPLWCRASRGAGSKAALPIYTPEQLKSWTEYWSNKGLNPWDFMVTSFLDGPEYAVQTFWIHGKLYHIAARERIEYMFGSQMASGQSSSPSVAKTVKPNEKGLVDITVDAIRNIDSHPHGIYCVDLKCKNDIPFPTEVNYGRFFTTSDFFATLGMNTPAAYMRYVLYGEFPTSIYGVEPDNFWIRGVDREPLLTDRNEIERHNSSHPGNKYEI